MHVFLYEWITGGGLADQPGRLPPSLLAEGSAMIAALAEDFAAIAGTRVSVLRDMRIDRLPLEGCDVVDVESLSHGRDEFDRLAAEADRTMVVAPEFDGILLQALRRLGEARGRSLNASDEFVAIATDKHRTAERLTVAGVQAPKGRVLEADESSLPADADYPAVLKPIDGAGSQHMLLVQGPGDAPPPYPWPRRLERYCPGRAASVAAICGPAGRQMLPPCWQRLTDDGRFGYLGGSIIREAGLAQRATALADRALDAMPEALGFVGVDLILGNDPHSRGDYAIEINPRLTTSYVCLRAAVPQNLAKAIVDVADGRTVKLMPSASAFEFDAAGAVWIP
jgi:tyramine---L-glutamate ligase